MPRPTSASMAPVEYPSGRSLFDPSPELDQLRATAPVRPLTYRDGVEGWLVTSHELGREFLALPEALMFGGEAGEDGRFAEARERLRAEAQAGPSPVVPIEDSGVFFAMDPPHHTRLRRALAGRFSAKSVEFMRPSIEAAVDDCIAAMKEEARSAPGGVVDAMSSFALPVTLSTICRFLGIPVRGSWHRPDHVIDRPESSVDEITDALREYSASVRQTVRELHDAPGSGLVSELIRGGDLSEEEVVGVTKLLIAPGHHTAMSVLGLGIAILLRDGGPWWHRISADPDDIGAVVEELLRYITVFHIGAATRQAASDIELGGVLIRRGERVTVSLMAANRDPGFLDRPNEFDPARDPAGHIAFGHGIHQCLGQHLARLELKIAFLHLARALPDLRIAVPLSELPQRPDGVEIFGVNRLPVVWGQR